MLTLFLSFLTGPTRLSIAAGDAAASIASAGAASIAGAGAVVGALTGCERQAQVNLDEPEFLYGCTVLDKVTVLTGQELKPYQTSFRFPEIADPYMTPVTDGIVVSGTSQYSLKFKSIEDIARGGPYQMVWNEFYYPDLTPMEGGRTGAHSWDMKPVPWIWSDADKSSPRLWDPAKDPRPSMIVWYGGHMRPRDGEKVSRWPDDNFSRDVFAFIEKSPGKWVSMKDSIFARKRDWPRSSGNFLGHRYGHQITMTPSFDEKQNPTYRPAVFFEEVTETRADGTPAVTKIFMDKMTSPFEASGQPTELISPINPATGKPFPSAIREGGDVLVEGPLYFRFDFEDEEWEAIGFSAGSFYGSYPAVFASRKVADGLLGKPFQIDLNDDGSDFHNAGADLGKALNLVGGPARPSVLVNSNGKAIRGADGRLQVLVHGYRRDILPDNDYSTFPKKYRFDQMFRIMVHAYLDVTKGPSGALRFSIATPQGQKPDWTAKAGLRLITPASVRVE